MKKIRVTHLRKGFVAALLSLLILCTPFSAGVCIAANSGAQVNKTIGALLPMTGVLASQGKEALATLKIAKADFEASYPGNSISLVTADTHSSGATALQELKDFYSKGIRVVIGPYSSDEVLAVKAYADANNMVIISPTCTTMSLRQNDNILRLSLDNAKQAEALAALMKNRGISNAIIVNASSEYGSDLCKELASQLTANSINLNKTITYDPASQSFDSTVADLHATVLAAEQSAKAENIGVVLIGYDESVSLLNTAASDSLLSGVKWFGTDSLAKKDIITGNKAVADFAAKTEFTASADDRQAFSMPVSPFSYLEQNLVGKLIASGVPAPDSSVYQAHDAYMLGAMTLARLSAKQLQSTNFKNAAVAMAANMYGINAKLAVDDDGDIINGSIGFYKVTQSGDTAKWELTAGYQFRLNTGSPHPTNTLFYREFSTDIQTADITVGALMPLTGSLSYVGQPALQAVDKAESDIEKTLGTYYTNSPSVNVVFKDTQSSPAVALRELKDLKAMGVRLVIGPFSTEELSAVRQYADENDMLLISPGCTAPSLSVKDNVYRLALNDTKQAQALSGYCSHEGIKDVIVLMNDSAYSQELYQSFKDTYAKLGGSVKAPVIYKQGTKDYKSYLAALNKAAGQYKQKKSTAVLMIAYDEAAQVLESAASYSQLSSLRWIGTDSTSLSTGILKSKTAAAFAAKTGFTASIMASPVRAGGQNVSTVTDVAYQDLCAALGRKLTAYDTNSYDALWICAMMYINSDFKFSGIDDYKNAFKTVTDRMISVTGSVKLDDNGDRIVGNFAFNKVTASAKADYAWKITGEYFCSEAASKNQYFPVN